MTLRLYTCLCLLTCSALNSGPLTAADDTSLTLKAVSQKYCVQCHGGGNETEGGVNLTTLEAATLTRDLDLTRKLINVLDQLEMPPEGEPQPTTDERQRLINALQHTLRTTLATNRRYPPTPMRRMNRFQYNNAVIDLFELNCVVFTLPERMMRAHRGYFRPESGTMPDVVTVGSRPLGKSQMIEPRLAGVAAFPQDLRAEHGFDNRGDHLSLSPLLMEAFLNLGQSITNSPDFNARNVGIWKAFFATPSATDTMQQEIKARLQPFLMRAFRGPVDEKILERYVTYVVSQLEREIPFTEAMKSVAAAVLSSPRFLYLYETRPMSVVETPAAQALSDFELATRLSFFLWGSVPDQTLMDAASRGDLQQTDLLMAQVDRMLKDQKLKRFCDSFPSQWLQLDRIISSVPNRERYPEFYYSKYRDSMHMMLEPLLLFETVLIENQSITQFIDSDFSYRSGHLEDAYAELAAVPDHKWKRGEVTVLNFHRVPVTDRRTGGLITNAAVMTMTSGPDRTQPITRGAWIATVVFNDPPAPPPADVPPLKEKPEKDEEHLTLRERLSLHRQRADCKGCHEQIDPLGFALENFDPIGKWRNTYENGRDVDASGALFRKHNFQNVIEFKDALLSEKDRFARALAGHLLAFALARELGPADQIALDAIVSAAAADDCKLQSLLKQVILSEPFQTKSHSSIR